MLRVRLLPAVFIILHPGLMNLRILQIGLKLGHFL